MTRTASSKVVSLSNTTSQTFKSELSNTKTQTGKTKMTTATSQSTQLSNNIIQVFKFDIDKSLELQGINIIYRKEDGYINLSQLCKAGGKEFSEWKRSKKSKEFLVQLEKTLNEGENVKKKVSLEISRDTLIKYNSGSNTERANWGHPQVAINVAQWISPEFDVKVSKWTRELTLQLEEKNKVIETKENEIKTLIEETKQYQDSLTTKQQNKTNFEQSTDIIELKLVLQNNSEINIPVSKDGYVNCTKLCQAGNKRIDNWNRLKQSKELIEAYSKLPHFRGSLILRSIEGKNGGTYYPIDISIQIAQWLSPSFALQVSRWTRELLLFGSVTLGQEKSNKELEEKFNQKIQSLQKTIETVVNENLKIKSTYSHLAELHDQIRMKRNYHKFKKGNCLYIITDRWREKDYLKIGYTDNINTRLQTYRTSMPDVKINFLLYLTENKFLEKCLKVRYSAKLVEKNHEYVIDATIEQLVKSINTLTKYLNIETTEETKLSLYNEPYKIYNLLFLDQNGNVENNTENDLDLSDQKKNNLLFLDQNGNIEDDTDLDLSDEKNDNEPKHECNTETEHDSDSEAYKCDICGTEYKTKSRFLNHMINVHNIQKDVKDD